MARGLGFSISAAISVVAGGPLVRFCRVRAVARARVAVPRLSPRRRAVRGYGMGYGLVSRSPARGIRSPARRAYGRMPSMACAGADCAAPTAPTGGARPTARAGAAGAAAALGDVLVRSRMSKNQHNRFTRLGPSLLSRDP